MRNIFGDDNAEDDALLSDCFLDRQSYRISKPIITGKWGTGKTASIIENCKEISSLLGGQQETELWYMDEHAFDINEIIELKKLFSDNRYNLEVALQSLWKAEIVRALVIQLGKLKEYYGTPDSHSWKFIYSLCRIDRVRLPIWKSIKTAVNIITSSSLDIDSADELKYDFTAIFNDQMYNILVKCIGEIPADKVKPKLAIEPIETPNSPLESEAGIAQLTISSLLNCYRAFFSPRKLNGAEIYITIPWHRYRKKDLNFPQKTSSLVKRMRWNELDLREFINKRIEYEFKEYHRNYSRKNIDPWATLFESSVRNDHCHVGYSENLFRYVLRHTHHRSRDVQRLARRIVEHAVETLGMTIEEVMLGRGGWKIPESTVKEAVRNESMVIYDERVIEGSRRYPLLGDIVAALHGLSVPFEFRDLKDRLSPLKIDTNEAIFILWECGFLGVEITPCGEQYALSLSAYLGTESSRTYESGGHAKIKKWYFFEHNHDGEPKQMIARFGESQEAMAKYVLHAICFDKLMLNVTRECPVGI